MIFYCKIHSSQPSQDLPPQKKAMGFVQGSTQVPTFYEVFYRICQVVPIAISVVVTKLTKSIRVVLFAPEARLTSGLSPLGSVFIVSSHVTMMIGCHRLDDR